MSLSMLTKIVRILEKQVQELKQTRRLQPPEDWDACTRKLLYHRKQLQRARNTWREAQIVDPLLKGMS